MKNKTQISIILGLAFTAGLSIMFAASQAGALQTTFPPVGINTATSTASNSFAKVVIDGMEITADVPNDTLTINTPGHITTSVANNTVTLKVTQMTCPLLQGIKGVDANGNFICGTI